MRDHTFLSSPLKICFNWSSNLIFYIEVEGLKVLELWSLPNCFHLFCLNFGQSFRQPLPAKIWQPFGYVFSLWHVSWICITVSVLMGHKMVVAFWNITYNPVPKPVLPLSCQGHVNKLIKFLSPSAKSFVVLKSSLIPTRLSNFFNYLGV